ncbi:hypothetical protein [Georgfuchsia toluolica]|nr:hypothetical protein [Georgfuchsia toluolica]
MLTPYDEFPLHTTPYPVSYIPSTDFNWDEGYFFGVINPDEKIFFCTGFRINPNTDMIGGYALFNLGGVQRTFRFSRSWRQDYNLCVGPFRVQIIEPLKKIRLILDDNDSGISFDILWEGSSPAFLEGHHSAERRGRRTTDQSRYTQPGTTSGILRLGKRNWDVGNSGWVGVRDHSWGLYFERPPFAVDDRWLPPKPPSGAARALRFWVVFKSGDYSGFYHMHEDAEGMQRKLDDVFGTPFGGRIYKGWADEVIEMAGASHAIEFEPGTRIMRCAVVTLKDSHGREWRQEMEAAAPPWVPQTIGYTPGSWKDGGTVHCYHGSETLVTEWDEFDFSKQPFHYVPYGADGTNAPDSMQMGLSYREPIHGVEYLLRITTYAPDGTVTKGAGHLEMFINGPYKPYGFK